MPPPSGLQTILTALTFEGTGESEMEEVIVLAVRYHAILYNPAFSEQKVLHKRDVVRLALSHHGEQKVLETEGLMVKRELTA